MSHYHRTEEQLEQERLLILQAQTDLSAFEALYNTYHEPIFSFVYQRLGSMDEARDVTSQVFVKAIDNLGKYRFQGVPFSSWLYRIAQNELNRLFNRNKLTRVINVDTDDLVQIGEELELDSYQEYHEKLVKLLPSLEPDHLMLIEMRFMEKRSFKEIGEILGITENNAKVKLYRLLNKMRAQLTK